MKDHKLSEYIYSSLPVNVRVDFSNKDKNMLRQFLLDHKNQWFKATELSKRVGLSGKGTQVQVRKCITELIEFEFMPIVSGPKGFCYTYQQLAIDKYLDNLEQRKAGIQRRIDALQYIKVNG